MRNVSNIGISRPSVASLYLHLLRSGKPIGTATGFVVEHESRRLLITNRHVMRGTDNVPPPETMLIMHNRAGQLGTWLPAPEALYDDQGFPLWLEHPEHPEWDVVALPLKTILGLDFYPHGGMRHTANGLAIGTGTIEHFFGVYSSRINAQSDLGLVWKPKVIREIVEAEVRGALSAELVLDVSALDTGEFAQTADPSVY